QLLARTHRGLRLAERSRQTKPARAESLQTGLQSPRAGIRSISVRKSRCGSPSDWSSGPPSNNAEHNGTAHAMHEQLSTDTIARPISSGDHPPRGRLQTLLRYPGVALSITRDLFRQFPRDTV